MLALQQYEAGLCRRCNQHLAESMDPNSDPDNPAATLRWIAEGPDECHSCKALAGAERQLAGDDEGSGQGRLAYSTFTPLRTRVKPRLRLQR